MSESNQYVWTNKGKQYSFDLSQLSPEEYTKFMRLKNNKARERFIAAFQLADSSILPNEISLKSVVYPDYDDKTLSDVQMAAAKYNELMKFLESDLGNEMKEMRLSMPETQKLILRNTNHITQNDIDTLLKFVPDMSVNQFMNYYKNVMNNKDLVVMNRIQKILKNPFDDDVIKAVLSDSDKLDERFLQTIVNNDLFEAWKIIQENINKRGGERYKVAEDIIRKKAIKPFMDAMNEMKYELTEEQFTELANNKELQETLRNNFLEGKLKEAIAELYPTSVIDSSNVSFATPKKKGEEGVPPAKLQNKVNNNQQNQMNENLTTTSTDGDSIIDKTETETYDDDFMNEDISEINERNEQLNDVKKHMENEDKSRDYNPKINYTSKRERETAARNEEIARLQAEEIHRLQKEEEAKKKAIENGSELNDLKQKIITLSQNYLLNKITNIQQRMINSYDMYGTIKLIVPTNKNQVYEYNYGSFNTRGFYGDLKDKQLKSLSLPYIPVQKIPNCSVGFYPQIRDDDGRKVDYSDRPSEIYKPIDDTQIATLMNEYSELKSKIKEHNKSNNRVGKGIFSRIKNTFNAPKDLSNLKEEINKITNKNSSQDEEIRLTKSQMNELSKMINALTSRVNELSNQVGKMYVDRKVEKKFKPDFLKDIKNPPKLKEVEPISTKSSITDNPDSVEAQLRRKMEERRKDIEPDYSEADSEEDWGGKIKIKQSDSKMPIKFRRFIEEYLKMDESD